MRHDPALDQLARISRAGNRYLDLGLSLPNCVRFGESSDSPLAIGRTHQKKCRPVIYATIVLFIAFMHKRFLLDNWCDKQLVVEHGELGAWLDAPLPAEKKRRVIFWVEDCGPWFGLLIVERRSPVVACDSTAHSTA